MANLEQGGLGLLQTAQGVKGLALEVQGFNVVSLNAQDIIAVHDASGALLEKRRAHRTIQAHLEHKRVCQIKTAL